MSPATPIGRRIAHRPLVAQLASAPCGRRAGAPRWRRSRRCRCPPARRRASRRAPCPSRASCASAISSLRAARRSPTRRSTSPRAGAGVRDQSSKPRSRRRDRRLDVRGARIREAADQVARVGRVAVLEVAAGARGDPLAGDEVLEGLGHRAFGESRVERRTDAALVSTSRGARVRRVARSAGSTSVGHEREARRGTTPRPHEDVARSPCRRCQLTTSAPDAGHDHHAGGAEVERSGRGRSACAYGHGGTAAREQAAPARPGARWPATVRRGLRAPPARGRGRPRRPAARADGRAALRRRPCARSPCRSSASSLSQSRGPVAHDGSRVRP